MICKGYSDWALLVNRGCHNKEGNKLKDEIRYLPTEFAGPCQALLNKALSDKDKTLKTEVIQLQSNIHAISITENIKK